MTLVSVGEILWDVFPDGREELGGAPFNFAFHSARLGHRPIFVSAVGEDARGARALERATLGLDTAFVERQRGGPGTGIVAVSLDEARQPTFALQRPAAYDQVWLSDKSIARIAAAEPAWICFGTLFFVSPENRALLHRLLSACPNARRFYDVNLRPGNWSEALVRELLPLADLIKLNEAEHELLLAALDGVHAPQCVTLAERGCRIDGRIVPGYPVQVADAVGAGDAFSAALLHGVAAGVPLAEAADLANRVGALVASRPGGTPLWTPAEAIALTR